MKPYTRRASASWLGTHQDGKGSVGVPSSVLKESPYVFTTQARQGAGTNPPELVAAAHAGSFSVALASELAHAGYHPRQIDTTATVTMENLGTGWTLTQIHLQVSATVPRAAQCDFIDAALRAKTSCPISRLLNATISMQARLDPERPKKTRGPKAPSAKTKN